MADLGNIGEDSMDGQFGLCPLDVYFAKDISLNPVAGVEPYLNLVSIASGDRKTINGHLFDASNNPIQRTVVCVDQVSLAVVDTTTSNASTGAFTLRPPINNKCAVFYIPNVGDAKNSVILSDLAPI